jgi:hypothetical protein
MQIELVDQATSRHVESMLWNRLRTATYTFILLCSEVDALQPSHSFMGNTVNSKRLFRALWVLVYFYETSKSR